MTMTKQELARESYELHSQIDELRKRLLAVNAELATYAEFPEGKNTSHFQTGQGYSVKVVRSERWKWDQKKLNTARSILGDKVFLPLFKFSWEPKRKTDVEGFIHHAPAEQSKMITDALTITPSTQVSVEHGDDNAL